MTELLLVVFAAPLTPASFAERCEAYLARAEEDPSAAEAGLRDLVPVADTSGEPAIALASACAAAARPALGADDARLREILAADEFADRGRDGDFTARVLEAISDWLAELLESDAVATYAVLSRWLVLWAAAFAAALGLVVALRRRRRPASAAEPASTYTYSEPSVHREDAEAALRRGDARAAVRAALLTALAALERRGLAPPGRARTNRELARELRTRAAPELATAFSQLASRYDAAVYGLAVTPEEARALLDAAHHVERLAGGDR